MINNKVYELNDVQRPPGIHGGEELFIILVYRILVVKESFNFD